MIRELTTAGLVALLASGCLTGCIERNAEPVERFGNRFMDSMDKVADKGLTELSAQSSQWIGAGALIEPGYRVRVRGFVGTGFDGEAVINIEGASGIAGTASQLGAPNRNVDSFGSSLLPPTDTAPSDPDG